MKNRLSYVLAAAILAALPAISRAQDAKAHKGKVTATMDSGGYTYVEFEENGAKVWAASAPFKVAVGDTIEFSGALPMENFASKSLNRTFPLIYFAGVIAKTGPGEAGSGGGAAPTGQLPPGHVPIPMKDALTKPAPSKIAPGSIAKADGGYSIAEIWARGKELAGKSVKVRGRVVKFMADILGRNWLHIQDGTGGERSSDLTVTTSQTVAVGDLVLVTGTLAADKDFGSGYAYGVIVEGAALKVEDKAK